jgi:hypothetical protein
MKMKALWLVIVALLIGCGGVIAREALSPNLGSAPKAGAASTRDSTTDAPGLLTARNGAILDPAGKPIHLTGWRVDVASSGRRGPIPLAEIERYKEDGLLGNAQGVEIWWSKDGDFSPSESSPHRPGVYNKEAVRNLLDTMRNFARAGSWVIPSIRVSYEQEAALENTRTGVNSWQGWADHRKVIWNLPVVVAEGPNAGTYGNHRDRFFKWLDWLIPQILADEEIADHIAYWEMWHYYGHKHNSSPADREQYLDDFIPRLIAQYRKHDPDRLLAVGLNLNATVDDVNARLKARTWEPYEDDNLIYVVGGYGVLGNLMRADGGNRRTDWPVDSVNPMWLSDSREFNIEKLRRLTPDITLHSQEGPGLREVFRETPIPTLQRTWYVGLLNLYNATTNGFGIHAWPPSWANEKNGDPSWDKTARFDETDFFSIMRPALLGEQVNARAPR